MKMTFTGYAFTIVFWRWNDDSVQFTWQPFFIHLQSTTPHYLIKMAACGEDGTNESSPLKGLIKIQAGIDHFLTSFQYVIKFFLRKSWTLMIENHFNFVQ